MGCHLVENLEVSKKIVSTTVCFTTQQRSSSSECSRLTALQEDRGSVLDLLGQLTRAAQVVEDEDVGRKQNHVLLAAAKRHGQELVYVLHGAAHDVT